MSSSEGPLRLHFLDGLRGLACLYVLFFHEATPSLPGREQASSSVLLFQAWFGQGRASVVFFIVLSGFSLMLPVVRSGTGQLKGGVRRFVSRRARRILPPYYAALVLSMLSIVVYNRLQQRLGSEQVDAAALGVGSVVSHFLLVHNAVLDWAYRINGPLWSVATEWQIYFVFALALLPLWRTLGVAATTLLAWVVGSAPFFLLPVDANLYWACPWFLGSFALGMGCAVVGFDAASRESFWRVRAPWGVCSLLAAGFVVWMFGSGRAASWGYPLSDLAVSALACAVIAACVRQRTAGERLLARLLSSRPLVYVGGFSYSLYLVQHPLIQLTEKLIARVHLGYDARVWLHLALATPFVMLCAWLFAELFERPFTNGGVLLPWLARRTGRGGIDAALPRE